MEKSILTAILGMTAQMTHCYATEADTGGAQCTPWAGQVHDTGYTEHSDKEELPSEAETRGGASDRRGLTASEHITPYRQCGTEAEVRADEMLSGIKCPAVLCPLIKSIMLYEDPEMRCGEPLVTPESGWARFGLDDATERATYVLGMRATLNGRKTTTEVIVGKSRTSKGHRIFMQSTGRESTPTVLEQQDAEDAINNIEASSIWKLILLAVDPKTYSLPDEPSSHQLANPHRFVTKAAVRRDGPLVAASNCRTEWYKYTWPWTPAIIWQYDPEIYGPG
jgi:hypothetical protein